MNERVEEPRTEEALAELPLEGAPEEAETAAEAIATGPSWLRLAYAFEFLIALIAVLAVWSEVGGQGHLDLLPWYAKLGCVLALSWCCVRFTAGLVEQPKTWNRRTIAWLAGILLVSIAMAGITYYYHLHEVPDEPDTDDTTATSVSARAPARTSLI